MAKKILIAFDDSTNAKRAVEFVANHFTADHEITLISVMQDVAALCEMASPELTAHFLSQRTTLLRSEEEKATRDGRFESCQKIPRGCWFQEHCRQGRAQKERSRQRHRFRIQGGLLRHHRHGPKRFNGRQRILMGSVFKRCFIWPIQPC